MSFISPLFFVVLTLFALAYYATPHRFRAALLLAASYAFYALSDWRYLILLIAASGAVYALGLLTAGAKSDGAKFGFTAAGVACVVAMIVAFKLAGALTGFLLPLGISFYSFKLISYLIEVYWDDEAVERDPVLFLLFPAFFPQIVSGPIQRPGDFFEQMRERTGKPAEPERFESAAQYILSGLMLKLLIGDRLSAIIGPVDAAHNDFTYGTMLATVACYTLSLYADFAGYTNIALGIGRVFGIQGPENFDAPFTAVTIQDMWRRWHMSLTSWVTDYLFTPLNMALRSLGEAGLMICITLNMVIIGLWHGLTLNFLVFGLLHAFYVIATVYAKRFFFPGGKNAGKSVGFSARALAGMALTFVLMSFSQIFWRLPTWDKAMSVLQQVLGLSASGPKGFADISPDAPLQIVLCGALALAAGSGLFGKLSERLDGFTPRWLQYGVWLFLLTVLSSENAGSFVYGQF